MGNKADVESFEEYFVQAQENLSPGELQAWSITIAQTAS